jgi:hypothetical protein
MRKSFYTRTEPEELDQFLKSISTSLRLKVQIYVMTRVLKHNKIITLAFKRRTINAIEFIVSKMELVLYSPDEKIINEGDKLDSKI